MLHISCPRCGTAAISIFSRNQSGIVSLGMATDLDKDEVKNKFLRNIISADEVIDMHEFFDSEWEDLVELMKSSK